MPNSSARIYLLLGTLSLAGIIVGELGIAAASPSRIGAYVDLTNAAAAHSGGWYFAYQGSYSWGDDQADIIYPNSGYSTLGRDNFAHLDLGFTSAVHISQICWYNGSDAGDYAQGWDLLYSDDGSQGNWVYAGGVSTAIGNYCITGDINSGRHTRWRLGQTGDARWRLLGSVSITYQVETPTATPAPIATDIPQGGLPCITGTVAVSATVQPTMTPYGRTATAAPTRTPGGPTPSATPAATHAPISGTASFDSGTLSFSTDVSQLSARGTVNDSAYSYKFLRWSDTAGNDGLPGVAWMHTNVGTVTTVTVSELDDHSGLVAFMKTGNWSAPVAVSFYARSAYTLTASMEHWMRVWYLDPDYDGHGTAVWVSQWDEYVRGSNTVGADVGGFQLSNSWRKFGAVVRPIGGSGQIAGIAFDDYTAGSGTPGDPCPNYGCVYLDDVRLAYGDAAGLVLPLCDGTSGSTSTRGGKVGKVCIINTNVIDLQKSCIAPTTLDFGAWLSYFWCRLWRFLGFFDENRSQVDAIITRQSINEPFGSLFETNGVVDDINASLERLRQANHQQVQSPIDWVNMFLDGSALDRTMQWSVPDVASAQTYMANCPAEAMFSARTASGACMALYLMRQTIVIQLFQWGLNALFVVGTLMMVRNDLDKLAS